MNVAQLIAALQEQDQEAEVILFVGNPDDTAFSNDVTGVSSKGGKCRIRAWVASDNEGACAPWSGS